MNTTDLIANAQDALALIEGADVHVRGQDMPADPDRLIVLDLITSRPLGDYDSAGRMVTLQVNTFGQTIEAALALADEARDALTVADWHEAGSARPVPTADGDTLSGITQDYTRS